MDELMMDWLYDELDPASSARVAEHIGTCLRCSAEAGSLRRAREAFRDLPLLDPPASVSAILLHEAARRGQPAAVAAAEARTGTGVPATPRLVDRLRGWLRPLVMHPALSATATLILVAGVAGTLYVRGRAGTAPSPAAETIAPAAPAAPAPGSERRFATPPGDRVGPDRLDGTEQAGLEQARSAGDRSVADDADHAAKMERKPAAEERDAYRRPD